MGICFIAKLGSTFRSLGDESIKAVIKAMVCGAAGAFLGTVLRLHAPFSNRSVGSVCESVIGFSDAAQEEAAQEGRTVTSCVMLQYMSVLF
jgi:hypothetical protein